VKYLGLQKGPPSESIPGPRGFCPRQGRYEGNQECVGRFPVGSGVLCNRLSGPAETFPALL